MVPYAEWKLAAAKFRRQMAGILVIMAIGMLGIIGTQVAVRHTQEANSPRVENTENMVRDVRRILRIAENITSPAAAAKQRQVLAEAIAAIGCDNRAALQDLLTQLIDRGILTPGDARIDSTCTTTTTTGAN